MKDYNSIVNEVEKLVSMTESSDEVILEQARTAQKACKRFKSEHPKVSCKAQAKYEVKRVKTSDVDSMCNFTAALIEEYEAKIGQ